MSYCTAVLFSSFILFMSLWISFWIVWSFRILGMLALLLEASAYPLSCFPVVLLFCFSSSATHFRKVFNGSPVCCLWALKHVLQSNVIFASVSPSLSSSVNFWVSGSIPRNE